MHFSWSTGLGWRRFAPKRQRINQIALTLPTDQLVLTPKLTVRVNNVLWRCRAALIPRNFEQQALEILGSAQCPAPRKELRKVTLSQLRQITSSTIARPTVFMLVDAHTLVHVHGDSIDLSELLLNPNVRFLLHSTSFSYYALDIIRTMFSSTELFEHRQPIFHPFTKYAVRIQEDAYMMEFLEECLQAALEWKLTCAVVACDGSFEAVSQLVEEHLLYAETHPPGSGIAMSDLPRVGYDRRPNELIRVLDAVHR